MGSYIVEVERAFYCSSGSYMPQVEGYILRIIDQKFADHVFDMAIYYTNLNRKWSSGQVILFVQKTELGDSFIGYGAIERVLKKDELCDEERIECERGKWQSAIEFKYVRRLERPLPIKETFLENSKLRGRFFHGLQLDRLQVESILKQASVQEFHQKS